MYCGIIRVQTISNRLLIDLYDLDEYDRSCFIFNDRVISIDILPSLTPMRELELSELLREDGVRSVYQAYDGDRPSFQRLLEGFPKMVEGYEPAPLKEQSFGISSGTRLHNRFITLLLRTRPGTQPEYLSERKAILPACFLHQSVVQERTHPGPFLRQELLNLFVEHPELHRKKHEANRNSILTSLIHAANELLTVVESEQHLSYERYRIIVRKLIHYFELSASFVPRSTLPRWSETGSTLKEDTNNGGEGTPTEERKMPAGLTVAGEDRIKVIERSGNLQRTLVDVTSVISSLKWSFERHEDTKLYMNRLIEPIDTLLWYFGREPIGVVRRDYSQHITCITNEQTLNFHYTSPSDRTRRRVLLSGEGLEELSRSELEHLLREVELHGDDVRFDRLRRILVERLAATTQ